MGVTWDDASSESEQDGVKLGSLVRWGGPDLYSPLCDAAQFSASLCVLSPLRTYS